MGAKGAGEVEREDKLSAIRKIGLYFNTVPRVDNTVLCN